MTMVTQQQLKNVLDYDPETGLFVWRQRVGKFKISLCGKSAGCINGHGYSQIRVLGRMYAAHRLAWLYVHGEWPTEMLDHINRNRSDNRIANLRQADALKNQHNRGSSRGLMGAVLDKRRNEWVARIRLPGRRSPLSVGPFSTAEEAHAAYLVEKAKHHPFANMESI